jgi:parallel beta-helix repeat protein
MRQAFLGLVPTLLCAALAHATTFYVDPSMAGAGDKNPGTADQPWKTIGRAAGAAELQPGDTVLIASGVYREAVNITRSGEPGKPLTFAAAPGARVVIKGSAAITGPWTRVTGDPKVKEPYPNAFSNVWRIHLGDEYFQKLPPNMHYISTVYMDDVIPLKEIGPDRIYAQPDLLSPVGHDLNDIFLNSFYFDKVTNTLYLDISGDPGWFVLEVGTFGFPFMLSKVHDVNVAGLEVRHNRQPGGQWPMATVSESERVKISDCSFTLSDFCGLSGGHCKNVTVERCNLSDNGDTGFSMSACEDCTIDSCKINGNNTRHFNTGWHAGGAKLIPNNTRITFKNCEAAYNDGPGIWFDSANSDNRILHNVTHHNDCGIFYEINPGGGLIADNLSFANHGRGIYISGSRGVTIVHNTVADNNCGIVIMPREDPFTVENDVVQNNLLLHNDISGATGPRGCDLTIFMKEDAKGNRQVMTNHAKSNLYALGLDMPTLRAEWNNNIALPLWQQRFGEDQDSRAIDFGYRVLRDAFQITDPKAPGKRSMATPLPAGLPWTPADATLVGSSITSWPAAAGWPAATP